MISYVGQHMSRTFRKNHKNWVMVGTDLLTEAGNNKQILYFPFSKYPVFINLWQITKYYICLLLGHDCDPMSSVTLEHLMRTISRNIFEKKLFEQDFSLLLAVLGLNFFNHNRTKRHLIQAGQPGQR